MVAGGARECLLRQDTGSLTWREWLPELSLEVVRDGHFGELRLLERGAFIDPFLGDAVRFEVPEALNLGAGHRWFSFPLRIGGQGRRLISWEARLESPAFPLGHDVQAKLELSYRYGLDNSFELVVEPVNVHDAPFPRLEAKWVRGGADTAGTAGRKPLVMDRLPWDPEQSSRFLDAARLLHSLGNDSYNRFLFGVTKNCWSHGRSLATAPGEVERVFSDFCDHLEEPLPRGVDTTQIPFGFEVLALLHEDAPSWLVGWLMEFDARAGDNANAFWRTAGTAANLVGDGRGERARLLLWLLDNLRKHTDYGSFNAPKAKHTMRALGVAAWRHPRFVESLVDVPGATDLVISQCRRSLHGLYGRIPAGDALPDERLRAKSYYGAPFRNACEILLALMAVDENIPAVEQLRTGSPAANSLAKLVRQIDARLVALEANLPWRISPDIVVPVELRKMSPVAFALNMYLSEGSGANLVRVVDVGLDDERDG